MNPERIVTTAALCVSLLFTSVSAYHSDNLIPSVTNESPPFQDTKDTWCEAYVKTCYQAGLVNGKTDEIFDVNGTLTNAQIVVIAARFYNRLIGVETTLTAPDEKTWYLPAYELLKSAIPDAVGTISGYLDASPDNANKPCSRESFAKLLTGILRASNTVLPEKNDVQNLPDSHDSDILLLYRAGILNGKDEYGTFKNSEFLTRGEASAILSRIIDPGDRLDVVLEPFDISKHVLHMEPETVLFTVNESEITAAQYAETLVNTIIRNVMVFGRAPSIADEDAIMVYCTDMIVPRLLADKLGISLTADDIIKARAYGESMDGYRGQSYELWYERYCSEHLACQVRAYYSATDIVDGEHLMISQYPGAIDEVRSTLEPVKTSAYACLDMEEIYTYTKKYFL